MGSEMCIRDRGRRGRVHWPGRQEGLIPACAGQTCATLDAQASGGLIPACAGQTTGACSPGRRAWAHPRVCGADAMLQMARQTPQGSSPRVRGRQGAPPGRDGRAGLIPACAGQTTLSTRTGSPCRAHPRVCGADATVRGWKALRWGSSPRVRGRQDENGDDFCAAGLIPACAGQTPPAGGVLPMITAHPRVCGADELGEVGGGWEVGSSPRVRGRPEKGLPPSLRSGLIPACAGQTATSGAQSRTTWAHPRVCGADLPRRDRR